VSQIVTRFRDGADAGTVATRDAAGPLEVIDDAYVRARQVQSVLYEERGYRLAQIRDGDAEHAQVAAAAAGAARHRTDDPSDAARAEQSARTLIRRRQRLEADLAVWRNALAEVEREEREVDRILEVLADNRAAVHRTVLEMERRLASADRRDELAGQLDTTNQAMAAIDAAADEVRHREGAASAHLRSATDHERFRIMQGGTYATDSSVDEELRRLRGIG
jgi:hypothetical protein